MKWFLNQPLNPSHARAEHDDAPRVERPKRHRYPYMRNTAYRPERSSA